MFGTLEKWEGGCERKLGRVGTGDGGGVEAREGGRRGDRRAKASPNLRKRQYWTRRLGHDDAAGGRGGTGRTVEARVPVRGGSSSGGGRGSRIRSRLEVRARVGQRPAFAASMEAVLGQRRSSRGEGREGARGPRGRAVRRRVAGGMYSLGRLLSRSAVVDGGNLELWKARRPGGATRSGKAGIGFKPQDAGVDCARVDLLGFFADRRRPLPTPKGRLMSPPASTWPRPRSPFCLCPFGRSWRLGCDGRGVQCDPLSSAGLLRAEKDR